jgi:hypothetical protein
MITTTHPVSPEDVMALADGELSGAEAAAVAAHVAECAECSSLAAQLAATSAAFAKWTVPDAPAGLYASVATHVADAGGGKQGSLFGRTAFLRGPRWSVAQMSAVAAVLLLVAAGLTMHYRSRSSSALSSAQMIDGSSLIDPGNSTRGSASRPVPAPPPPPSESLHYKAPQGDQVAVPAQGLAMAALAAPSARAPKSDALEAKSTSPAPQLASAAPMIARTASLTIVVKDLTAARSSLDSILARRHGYSAQLNVFTPENLLQSAQASLRVPVGELAFAIGDLKTLGHVENEIQSGEEVTQQHADLVARLQNSRETEQRLRAILEQRTGKIEDVLQVEEEIARVRGEIEQMEADQEVLEHRVDFATIDLRLTEQYREQLEPQSATVSMQIRNAFVTGLRHAGATLLGILLFLEEAVPTVLIWLAILAVPGFLFWRRYRRLSAKI